MLIDDKEIHERIRIQQNRIEEVKAELRENKKDLKYKTGVLIGENLHPRKKIFTIPGKLRKMNREYIGVDKDEVVSREDPIAYYKYLQDEYRQLSFYNEKEQSDITFAIGEEVYKAQHSLVACIHLPFSLWKIRKENQRLLKRTGEELPVIEGIDKCVLFIATNGAGLGHLTRCLAVARRMKKLRPETEIIFLTTSLALTVVQREGFTAYCIPSQMMIKNISSGQWHALLRTMMSELLQLYRFEAVIFDGAFPYASITATMAGKKIPKIWIRRGSEKSSGIAEKRVAAEKDFDYIIIPGEANENAVAEDEKHLPVPPIVYLDKNEIWSREDVRRYLKIPKEKTAVYIQLGAGNINDIDSDISKVVSELRKYPDVVMVLGESLIGDELKVIEDDIIVIKDYPNSKYFNGFDFAISACGYNSFHELVYFGIPAIFLPNMNTKSDDQYARAMIAQNQNAGMVVTELGSKELTDAIAGLMDKAENEKMRQNGRKIIEFNGADNAATIIVDMLK